MSAYRPVCVTTHKTMLENCYCCETVLDETSGQHWLVRRYEQAKKSRIDFKLFQVCRPCEEAEQACDEAEADGRRFTQVGVGVYGSYSFGGDRCVCGAVTVTALAFCVQCSKRSRMLGKLQAEQKQIAGLLVQLRREARNKQKELTNAS